jgi:rod shape-determining protein MreC
MLAGKNHAHRRRAVLGLLLAASITLLTLSFREGSSGAMESVQRGVQSVTAPFAEVATRVARPFVDAWSWTTGLVDARQENERLREQLDRAGGEQVQSELLAEQNRELRQLLDFAEPAGLDKLGANVIVLSPTAFERTIVLDVGSSDGVSRYDAVVAPAGKGAGLIGRVESVAPDSCTVLLLTDRRSSVTARVQGAPGAWGLVEPSDGDPGQLDLGLVDVATRVPVGEVVLTAGYRNPEGGDATDDNLLPPGIPIGEVTSASQSPLSQYHSIQVTPYVDFRDLSQVVVLKGGDA